MPTFYEGEPIAVVQQTLTEEEYAQAAFFADSMRAVINRKGVRAAICLTAAALALSSVPAYLNQYATAWIPFVFAGLALLLAAYFFFTQPKRKKAHEAAVFRETHVLAESVTISVYRDSVAAESQVEQLRAYWTDYCACYENREYIVCAGGWDRNLLILAKKNIPEERREAVSAHMQNTFASKYRRVTSKR